MGGDVVELDLGRFEQAIGDIVGEVNITILRNSIKDFIRHRTECPFNMTPLKFEIDGYG